MFHALLVTLAIYLCGRYVGFKWNVASLIIIWSTHWIQDCFRLAAIYMQAMGQFKYFKEHLPEAYIVFMILIDNIFHIALLFFLKGFNI